MNKYLTFSGQQPVYLGDVDFLQESVREAFLQLLRGLTGQDNPRCIIAEATPEKDGVICFDGEIMPLKHTAGAIIGNLVYKIESSYSGERTFKSGDTHKCYETRYVVGVAGSTLDPDRTAYFPKFSDLLARSVNISSAPLWTAWDFENVYFRITNNMVGNLYHIIGKFGITEDCTLKNIAEDIVVGYPIGTSYFPITVESGGSLKCVPAKMIVTYDEATEYNKATITINETKFSMGDEGSFYLTILKQ